MSPPVPASVSKPVGPPSSNLTTPPTSSPVPTASRADIPTHHRLELRGGGRLAIGDLSQMELGAAFRPTQRWSVGGGLQTDFRHKVSVFGEGGFRFHPSNRVSVQPTLLVGLGRLFDQAAQAGSLKENILLNGTVFFLNPEVRFQVHLTPRWGFFVAPSYNFEVRASARAQPSRLMTGENSHPNAHVFGINFGILFGAKPQKAAPVAEVPKKLTPPPPAPVKPPPPPAAKAPVKEVEPEEKIIAQVAEIKKDLPVDQAKKFDGEIGKVRGRLAALKTSLQYMNDGINRTNEIVRRLTETNYEILKNPRLKISAKDPIHAELKALQAATVLNEDKKPISLTETSEQIRNGLRVTYPAARGNPLYGERIVSRLDRLATQLKGRENAPLVQEIRRTAAGLRKFLKEFASPIKIEDFRQEVKIIGEAMKGLEPLAKELKLTEKPKWISLQGDLKSFEEAVDLKTREAEVFSRLVTAVNGPQNDFLVQMSQPATAKEALDNALRFLGTLSQNQARLKVSLTDIKKTYSAFFGLLELNLDTFISHYTPPLEKRLAVRRVWADSLLKARDLLCVLRADHPRCKSDPETVAPLPQKARAQSGTQVKRPRVAPPPRAVTPPARPTPPARTNTPAPPPAPDLK